MTAIGTRTHVFIWKSLDNKYYLQKTSEKLDNQFRELLDTFGMVWCLKTGKKEHNSDSIKCVNN